MPSGASRCTCADVARWIRRPVVSSFLALCALLMIVFPGAASTLMVVSSPLMGLYEIGVGLWLVVRGVNLHEHASG